MEWDIYVDESGKFTDSQEYTLIGGFLCPHDKHPSTNDMQKWRDEIMALGCRENVFTEDLLTRGDRWHVVKPPKTGKPDRRTEEQKAECESLRPLPRYVFDHCSENVPSGNGEDWPGQKNERWPKEKWALDRFKEKIAERGGRIVIFDNKGGKYHIDSNTTYLTIMAIGIMRLYLTLKNEHPQERIVLYIHAASRLNVTKSFEKEQYKVSPLAGRQGTLEQKLYVNQIKSCIFLNGGYSLLENREFVQALDEMEIMEDVSKKPHPATVVCDYICNGRYVSGRRQEFAACFGDALILPVFSEQTFDMHRLNLDQLADEQRWNQGFIELCSRDFPKDATEEFFMRMQRKHVNQLLIVRALVDYLNPYVSNRITMDIVAERIEKTIEGTKGYLNGEAYDELKANMLLYLDALYTHMGRSGDVERVTQAFNGVIAGISEIERRNALILLFCNREIVTCTDLFQYERGCRYYRILENYYEKAVEQGNDLLLDFLDIQNNDNIADSVMVQFGKAQGSYIQILTHMLRRAAGGERQKIEAEARRVIPGALTHFTTPDNLSRGCQNLCDLYIGLRQYDEALDSLFRAVGYLTEENPGDSLTPEEKFAKVIDFSGRFGEKSKYIYLHAVLLLHRLAADKAYRGKIRWNSLIQCITLGETPLIDQFADHLQSGEYPDMSIFWHLGGAMARTEDEQMQALARDLFIGAYEQMNERDYTLRAIAIAACAEAMALGLNGDLPGNKWQKKAEKMICEQYPAFVEFASGRPDPFRGLMPDLQETDPAQKFMKVSEVIAY